MEGTPPVLNAPALTLGLLRQVGGQVALRVAELEQEEGGGNGQGG